MRCREESWSVLRFSSWGCPRRASLRLLAVTTRHTDPATRYRPVSLYSCRELLSSAEEKSTPVCVWHRGGVYTRTCAARWGRVWLADKLGVTTRECTSSKCSTHYVLDVFVLHRSLSRHRRQSDCQNCKREGGPGERHLGLTVVSLMCSTGKRMKWS